MRLTILYFARLREALDCAQEQVTVPSHVSTVGQLRSWLKGRGERWSDAFERIGSIRVAVDQVVTNDSTKLREDAEVAFFPPVTGG
jgi:molybdopterin synthase sulfur carrier subunit